MKVYRQAEVTDNVNAAKEVRVSGLRRVYNNIERSVGEGVTNKTLARVEKDMSEASMMKSRRRSTLLRPSLHVDLEDDRRALIEAEEEIRKQQREEEERGKEGRRVGTPAEEEGVDVPLPPLPSPLVIKELQISDNALLLGQSSHDVLSATFMQAARVGDKRFVRLSGSEEFEKAASTAYLHAVSSGEERGTFQLCIGGGDGTILAFLSDLLLAHHRKPDAMRNLQLEIYLLPLGDANYLARFLALYDGWYGATVFSSISNPLPQLPHINAWDEEQSEDDDLVEPLAEGLSSPLHLLRRQVRNYIRDARHTSRIVVFECEIYCYRVGLSEVFLNCTIPFCQRAQIVNQADEHGRKLPIADDKGKGMSAALNVVLEYTEMNAVGVLRQKPVKEIRQCSSLHFSNIPREREKTVCPQPSLEALEMVAMSPDPAKRKKTRLPGVENLVFDGRSYHVTDACVSAPDGQGTFEVVLDGEKFGPACMIKIKPTRTEDGRVIHFPVQTFFPIDL
mmetsp:Transcript_30825/g.80754  ORF Transcript_30825/g.80754 Transcript_30825/m.80754 type:complete len:507 (+) Transcript_30825:1499-3019(+)